jgi:DnaK suppressor protein
MNETDKAFFKSYLLNQKSSIMNRSNEFKQEQSQGRQAVSEDFEAAASEVSNNIMINLHERDRSQLLLIERALGKLESGQYGCCESCGDFIESRRLKARPFASLCINCKEEEEDIGRFFN